mmetsp:Transcript_82854/g.235025  ORF Transcript_82854/g.235025 Transcript_82854/m.235025 type:complete len:315 (+) Transcript_82854:451-1395(+)
MGSKSLRTTAVLSWWSAASKAVLVVSSLSVGAAGSPPAGSAVATAHSFDLARSATADKLFCILLNPLKMGLVRCSASPSSVWLDTCRSNEASVCPDTCRLNSLGHIGSSLPPKARVESEGQGHSEPPHAESTSLSASSMPTPSVVPGIWPSKCSICTCVKETSLVTARIALLSDSQPAPYALCAFRCNVMPCARTFQPVDAEGIPGAGCVPSPCPSSGSVSALCIHTSCAATCSPNGMLPAPSRAQQLCDGPGASRVGSPLEAEPAGSAPVPASSWNCHRACALEGAARGPGFWCDALLFSALVSFRWAKKPPP